MGRAKDCERSDYLSYDFISPTKTELALMQDVQSPLTLEQRHAFLKLPIEERRRILDQQATEMVTHYQENPEWKESLVGDVIDEYQELQS